MKAKFVCGTEGASAQPTCRIWVQMCGFDGIKILGTPLGCAEFQEAATDAVGSHVLDP